MRKAIFRPVILILLAAMVLVLCRPVIRAADKPLSADDVTLLLIGGASAQKMADLIKQRGIGFKMTAELATGFRRDGADDTVIQALESASSQGSSQAQTPQGSQSASQSSQPTLKRPTLGGSSNSTSTPSGSASPAPSTSAPVVSGPAPGGRIGADGVSAPVTSGPGSNTAPVLSPADGQTQQTAPSSSSGSASGPVLVRHAPVVSGQAPVASASTNSSPREASVTPAAPRAKRSDLSDPSAAQVQQIIQAFAAKETLFKQARDNYTYHQINKVQEVGPDGEVTGQFQQDWDILYDDNGSRIERVTYAPLDSLKSLILTQQDYDAFRSIQPFVMTTAELPEYDVQYKGHVQVDEVTAYVFSLRPKQVEKGRQYFQGMVWVDDRDLQIVKSEGKQVPEIRMKHGEENLFPRFTTWREQIDGKFWFPTFTLADDTLYFQGGPVHMKEIIRYTDYKQFKTTHKITNVASVPGNTGQQPQGRKNPPN